MSPRTVARLLRALGYSLRVNHKCIPSASPAERNDQFEFIDHLRRDCARLNTPTLSIDTKICLAIEEDFLVGGAAICRREVEMESRCRVGDQRI